MANDTVIRPSKKLSLLSCPFCGSNRVQVVRSFIDSDSNIVHCPHCDACGPRALSTEPEGTAEARWNASRATHETPTPTSNSKALLEEIARWIRTVRDDVFEHGNICGRTQRSGEDLLRRIDTVVMDSGSHETLPVEAPKRLPRQTKGGWVCPECGGLNSRGSTLCQVCPYMIPRTASQAPAWNCQCGEPSCAYCGQHHSEKANEERS